MHGPIDIDREFLLEGIEHVFLIKNAQPNTAEMHNYKSVTSQYHEQVENQIWEEIREGRYVVTPTNNRQCSWCYPEDWRLIHDASKPEGQGLNDYVSTKMDIKFQSVNSAT